jgi:hypothetical protein
MKQNALKNVSNYLNINIYSYLETSGGQSYNLYMRRYIDEGIIYNLNTFMILIGCYICNLCLYSYQLRS